MARKHGKDRGLFFKPDPTGPGKGPKRKTGLWGVEYYDYDGSRHRLLIGTKSQAIEFRDAKKEEKRERRRCPEKFLPPIHLKQLIDEHVLAKKASGDKTAAVIERRLNEVLEKLGDLEATDIPATKIERLKLDLTVGPRTKTRHAKRKPASINRFLQDLRAVLNRALEARKILHSPFRSVELLTENNERAREMTPEEAAAFWAGIPAHPPVLRPYFQFLGETGARAGEAAGLTWQKILWRDSQAELPDTKAGKKQYLVLNKKAMAILRSLPRLSERVFCWPDGRPVTVDYATHVFHDVCVSAGIKDLRQHDLRHGFAIRRLRAGVNIVVISGLLRHSARRSSDRYLHYTRDDLRQGAEAGSDDRETGDGATPPTPDGSP
jgi:integrase